MTVWFLRLVALVLAVVVAAGFAGAAHPAGDSLAVFRVPLTAAAAVAWLSFWSRKPVFLAGMLVFGLILGAHGLGTQRRAATTGANAIVYQKNLLFIVRDHQRLAQDIATRAPDVVMFQEVSDRNRGLLEDLRRSHPAQQFCRFAGVGGVAVLSRWPKIDGSGRCPGHNGLAAMQVQGPEGPVWVISVHLHWPWPYGQARQVEKLVPALEAMIGPKLIGGDFNMVAWGNSLKRIEAASETRRIGHHAPTFTLPRIGLAVGIDHVLASGGLAGEISVLPKFASDHHGVLARATLPPRGENAD